MKLNNSKLTKALLASTVLTVASFSAMAQSGLDEVVVTAEKRTTNLQDTPISITAVTSETLEFQNIVTVNDLTAIAPNVAIKPGLANPSHSVIAIRGVGMTADESLTTDSPNGIYIDGVLIAKSAASALEVSNIEQVEVLRGPQGTLFGRNSTGGAVSFITKRPSEEYGGDIILGIGDYGQRRARLNLNTGTIGESLKVSLSLSKREMEGYVDNKLEGLDSKDPGAFDNYAGRLGVAMDLTDSVEAYYSYDWAQSDAVAPAYQTQQATATAASVLTGSTTNDGCSLTIPTGRVDSLCLNDSGEAENDTEGHMLQLKFDLDGMVLTSTTGRRNWDNINHSMDLDGFGDINGVIDLSFVPGTNPSFYSASNDRSHEQSSQELTLASDTDSNIQWVVGFYYLDEEGSENGREYYAYPLPAAFGGTKMYPGGVEYSTNAKSKALYGQISIRPEGYEDRLGVTVGARTTKDEKEITSVRGGGVSASADFEEPTGHITVDYRVNDDTNAYAKISRGYRSGGFNPRSGQAPFDSETITALEFGVKAELNDTIRINGAVFRSDYKDRQMTQGDTNGVGGYTTTVTNAAEQTIQGIEVEVQAILSDNFTAFAGLGLNDVETDGLIFDVAGVGDTDIGGELLNQIPETTANIGIQYNQSIGLGDMTVRMDANYQSEEFYFSETYTAPFAADLEGGDRTLVNAQVKIDNLNIMGTATNSYVMLWGKNITDEEYVVRAIDFGALGHGGVVYGMPAMVGIDLGFRF